MSASGAEKNMRINEVKKNMRNEGENKIYRSAKLKKRFWRNIMLTD